MRITMLVILLMMQQHKGKTPEQKTTFTWTSGPGAGQSLTIECDQWQPKARECHIMHGKTLDDLTQLLKENNAPCGTAK